MGSFLRLHGQWRGGKLGHLLPVEARVVPGTLNYGTVSGLILLIRAGDSVSLGKLREILGTPAAEIAAAVGVDETALSKWEVGSADPNSGQMAKWRLSLSPYVDDRIGIYLGTDNPDVVHHFWELAWRLG